MSPEEIKSYFEKNPPPTAVDWKPWAKITDTARFLEICYLRIEVFKGRMEDCPAWWRLREFYKDMRDSDTVKNDK